MSNGELRVARTGRNHQRYENGFRLVAGCIPYRVRNGNLQLSSDRRLSVHEVEVMMISSQHGDGFLFPKGGWETDETAEQAAEREAMEEAGVLGNVQELVGTFEFKSKRQKNEFSLEGNCRAHIFVLLVMEELEDWPEKNTRRRQWLTVDKALEQCRHEWMQNALRKWILDWNLVH